MKSKPNKAVAVDGGVRRLFHTGRSWPAATEPQCSLFMKPLALVILLAISSASASEKLTTPVIELPRPNSGTFSFAQAEARKSEILSNAPSRKLESRKNPYMGFCIHIAKDDSVTVYNHWLKALPDYSKPRPNQSVAEIKKLIDELPLQGNPAGVLVTSDAPLRDSKRIHKILEVLFVQVGAQVWRLEASFPARQDRYSENDVGREAMALCIALYGTTERRLDSEPPG